MLFTLILLLLSSESAGGTIFISRQVELSTYPGWMTINDRSVKVTLETTPTVLATDVSGKITGEAAFAYLVAGLADVGPTVEVHRDLAAAFAKIPCFLDFQTGSELAIVEHIADDIAQIARLAAFQASFLSITSPAVPSCPGAHAPAGSWDPQDPGSGHRRRSPGQVFVAGQCPKVAQLAPTVSKQVGSDQSEAATRCAEQPFGHRMCHYPRKRSRHGL